jgi:uncharacterized Zn finger protein
MKDKYLKCPACGSTDIELTRMRTAWRSDDIVVCNRRCRMCGIGFTNTITPKRKLTPRRVP